MKWASTTAAIAVVAVLAGCGVSQPIPQGTTSPGAPTPSPAVSRVSTCDKVREAFLTGTGPEITVALRALVADKSADGTAREYAQRWLTSDAKDPSMRDMDKSLIQSQCEIVGGS
jgi:hypothetical protein